MKKKYSRCTPVILLLIFLHATSIAQVSISNSTLSSLGVNLVDDAGISISATLGQLTVNTLQNKKVMLTQGIHQPYYQTATAVFTERYTSSLQVKAYPNPFVNQLFVSFEKLNEHQLISYQLITIAGLVIMQGQLQAGEQGLAISTDELPVGIYLLRITDNEQLVHALQLHKLK